MYYTLIRDGIEEVLPINYRGRIFFDIAGNAVEIPEYLYDPEFSWVDSIVEAMNPAEQYAVKLYYGAESDRRLNFAELGERLGFTEKEAGDCISTIRYTKLIGADRKSYLLTGIHKPLPLLSTQFAQVMDLKNILLDEIYSHIREMEEESIFLGPLMKRCGIEIEPGEVPVEDSTPVEQLDLSVRAFNCLRRAKITTIGDLKEMDEYMLLRVRNLGRKSYEEILEKMRQLPKNPYTTVTIPYKGEKKVYYFQGDTADLAGQIYWLIVGSRPGKRTIFQNGMYARLVMFLMERGYFFMEDVLKDRVELEELLSEECLDEYIKQLCFYCELEKYETKKKEGGIITLRYTPHLS